jgi:FkbM family methyltransferase
MYDASIIKEVLDKDSYNFKTCKLQEGIIIDIGAHIGSFSILAAHLYPEVQVKSFEMVPDNFNLLKENTKTLPNITIFNGTVVGEKIPSGFTTHETNSGGCRVVWCEGYNKSIDVFPIKDIVTEKVSFLKLDCEGIEHYLIDSLILHNKIHLIDKIGMEYHNFWGLDGKDIEKKLVDSGFQIKTYVYNPQCGLIWAWRSVW